MVIVKSFAKLVVTALIGLMVIGCASDQVKSPKIESSQQLGSIHVAAISVNRWEDYTNVLQPQFPVTPALALQLALPRTSLSQNNYASILSGGLQIGLPQSTQTSSVVKALSQGQTGGAGTTNSSGTTSNNNSTGSTSNTTSNSTSASTNNSALTQNTSTQEGPGALPQNLLPTAATPNAATIAALSGSTQNDPITDYEAATAIYEEIQLLNNYINDAALRYDYIPYLARVQVSVSPYARNEPYDTYIDLGVFSTCDGKSTKPVTLIPLLVTDDVETGQATNASNIARQLALSLGGTVSNAALQAGLSDLKDKFNAILGTDFNSLFMVTRGENNVLQVRLGAARNPNLQEPYAMLTQTHNVSFLMLVDKQYAADNEECFQGNNHPQIWANSYAHFRNAVSGIELPSDRTLIRKKIADVVSRNLNFDDKRQNNLNLTNKEIRDLSTDVVTANTTSFIDHFCAIQSSLPEVECKKQNFGIFSSLWTGISSALSLSEYTALTFDLPKRKKPPIDESQLVFFHDNCKDTVSATLNGFGAMLPSKFSANLKLENKLNISATSITQSTPGGPFTFQFPSLGAFGQISELTDKGTFQTACPSSPTSKPVGGPDAPAVKPDDATAQSCSTTTKSCNNVTKSCKKASKACSDLVKTCSDAVKACSNSVIPTEPVSSPVLAKLTGTLTVNELVTNPWNQADQGKISGQISYTFNNIYYDNSLKSVDNSISLSPATYWVTTNTAGTGQVRLSVKLGKNLDSAVLSFDGAALNTPLPTNGTPVEAPTQPPATLRVTAGIVDVNLQGLRVTHPVNITISGAKNQVPVPGAVFNLSLPVLPANGTGNTTTTTTTSTN